MVARMTRILIVFIAAAGAGRSGDPPAHAGRQESVQSASDLQEDGPEEVMITPPDVHLEIARKIRARHRVPALALAVVRTGEPPRIAATGLRKARGKHPVTVHDKWHLGSCTKSMTATMIAALVEQGRMAWDDTPARRLPEPAGKIHPKWRDVTLEQLLCHTAGLPEDRTPDLRIWPRICALTGELPGQRQSFVELIMSRAPASAPGEKYVYANAGFVIAAAMAEAATGESYEALMSRLLFNPLGMASAGFGPPGDPDKVDQPWGHDAALLIYQPIPPGPGADNPPVYAPSGTAHMSIGDWAAYAHLHLQALRGNHRLLRPETWRRIHGDPFGQGYAFGWATGRQHWASGPVLAHDGSNGRWYAIAVLAPRRDLAILVATNAADATAEKACVAAIEAIKKHYGPAGAQ
ncbi:MAG: hypothetical protein DCC65_05715 [Planctomycetota bacterium]|nr:MAG: hypothetical protein DCC65_05715 [Planctomycetota bacterium]